MSNPAMAALDAVGFRYRSRGPWAVRDLSFRVARGSVHGLAGPNGSGKTTIYRLLMGFIQPELGSVSVDGVEPARYRVGKGIGYLPEQVRLPGAVRVGEFAVFMARLAGHPGRGVRSVTKPYIEALGLTDRFATPIGSLSHGFRQRVGLLAVLLGDPQLVLLDEPATGLDPGSVGLLRSVIRGLRRRGRTIVVSSHNLAELERVCDELSILREGALLGRCGREALDGRPGVWVVRLSHNGRLRSARLGQLCARFGGVRLATDEVGFEERRSAREFVRRVVAAGAAVEAVERRPFDLEFLFHSLVQEESTDRESKDESGR
ncbi:MAG: ABC transporter ATP-binding protein [Gemmatimonadales bacterium]|jgi:ABC-2 type transport system ATP-binding protein